MVYTYDLIAEFQNIVIYVNVLNTCINGWLMYQNINVNFINCVVLWVWTVGGKQQAYIQQRMSATNTEVGNNSKKESYHAQQLLKQEFFWLRGQ